MHTMPMHGKRERHGAILRLVREQALSTQSEVATALRDEGYDVVQTTVSRDISELGLVKVRAPSGRLVYAPPGTGDADRMRALATAVRRYALDFEVGAGIVIVTTPPGYASPLPPRRATSQPPRMSPARSPARTRSSSPRGTASPLPGCGTS